MTKALLPVWGWGFLLSRGHRQRLRHVHICCAERGVQKNARFLGTPDLSTSHPLRKAGRTPRVYLPQLQAGDLYEERKPQKINCQGCHGCQLYFMPRIIIGCGMGHQLIPHGGIDKIGIWPDT